MTAHRTTAALALAALVAASATASGAEKRRTCLTKDAQRAAVASGQAVPLARAMRAVRPRNSGEVVRAQLCHGPHGLVYVLTLLPRSGKVMSATVDAANGKLLGGG